MTDDALTLSDIERYAAQFGDGPYKKLGVLLAVIEHLMSDDKLDRGIQESDLRQWAGGKTPARAKSTSTPPAWPGTDEGREMTDLSAQWDEIENADMPNIFKYAYEQARIYNGYDADAWDRLEPAKRAHKVSCFLVDMLVAHHGGETVERMIINVDTHAVEVEELEMEKSR